MNEQQKKFWATLGIWGFGYLAENKIKDEKDEGNKGALLDIAHAFSKDMQDNPERYYDFGEELHSRYQKWKEQK